MAPLVPVTTSEASPSAGRRLGLIPLHNAERLAYDQSNLPPEELYPIDIVAVHGINGDACTTWTHENGYFWLRDSVPDTFRGARVYSYGYPADIFRSLEKGDLDSYARGLLLDLSIQRMSKQEQRRPIIFICHSMGGLVVKKAMNITVVDSDEYEKIRVAVTGIMFLATPHRGSDPAKMATMVASILNISTLGLGLPRTRSDLLEGLKRGSPELVSIARDFRHHLTPDLKIYSFYEMKLIPPLKTLVVDEWSASMNCDMETPVSMDSCDHRTICRFDSAENPAYKRVAFALGELAEQATQSRFYTTVACS